MKNYLLIKSYSKIHIDAGSDMLWKLIVLNMTGVNALRFSPIHAETRQCTITFENAVDQSFLQSLFHTLDQSNLFTSPITIMEKP